MSDATRSCLFCDAPCATDSRFCRQCGGKQTPETSADRVLGHLARLRSAVRQRTWGRMAEAAKAAQELLNRDRSLAAKVEDSLSWLAHDVAVLLEEPPPADLPKLTSQAKNILPLIPVTLAKPLQSRVDALSKFLETLTAVEKQAKEKGAPTADKLKSWLLARAKEAGISYGQAHACIYGNPSRWPTVAATLDPAAYQASRALALCALGEKELRDKNLGNAKKQLAAAVAKDPQCLRACESLASVEVQLQNQAEAIRLLRQAIRLGTREARTFNNLAWYLATSPTPTPADLDEAWSAACRAVELESCDGFYDTLAEVQAKRGAWADAMAALREACRINPDRADFREKLQRFEAEARSAQAVSADDDEFSLTLETEGVTVDEDSGSDEDAGSQVVALEEDSEGAALIEEDSACESDFELDLEDADVAVDEETGSQVVALDSEEDEPAPAARKPRFSKPTGRMATSDQVQFTVTSQKELTPGEPTLIDVWAHLADERLDVLARAQEAQRGEAIANRSSSNVEVMRGSTITARLHLVGFEVPDGEAVILWDGGVGNASFPVLVPEGIRRGKHLGFVVFLVEGRQIAKLHFDVVVAAVAKRCRSAFASYQSDERPKVTARLQGLQKALPELDVFLDVVALRSGQNWEQRLRDEIARRDVFYLFWSRRASQSREVEKEWRLALELRGPDYIEPIPLDPPKLAPPPKELAHKHFNDWTLMFQEEN